MNTKQFIDSIRRKIAGNELSEAITALQVLLSNSPKLDEVLVQSARHTDIIKQIRLGTVDFETANVTKNQIRLGLVELLTEIEKQESADIQQEMQQSVTIINSKNVVNGSTVSAAGDIHIGDKNITQKADKIYNIDKIDKANFS